MFKTFVKKIRDNADRIVSRRLQNVAKQIIRDTESGDYLVRPTPPYYSQFASKSLVSDILDKKRKARNDPGWTSFGFATIEEYEFWAWRLCGLVCVKMVLDAYKKASAETVASLTKLGVELGGYDPKKDVGWFAVPLVKLARRFSLNGKVYRVLSTEEIAKNILDNEFVIASVNPRVIRNDTDTVPNNEKNGHLILVWGVKIQNGKIIGFYIHNPSGRTSETQQKAFIPSKRFRNSFGRRGFSLYL